MDGKSGPEGPERWAGLLGAWLGLPAVQHTRDGVIEAVMREKAAKAGVLVIDHEGQAPPEWRNVIEILLHQASEIGISVLLAIRPWEGKAKAHEGVAGRTRALSMPMPDFQ